jgi:excisionase family DNA binding protein
MTAEQPPLEFKLKDTLMKLAELVEEKTEALCLQDIANILHVSTKQVYKMAAKGQIPSMRIASAIRFDPEEFGAWLRAKYPARTATQVAGTTRPA